MASLTVGRFYLVLVAAGLLLDGVAASGSRSWWPRRRSAQALAAGLIAEGAVITVNQALLGQNTAGALAGYLELVCVALATIVVLERRPELAMTLLMFAGAGVVIGCLDALVTGDSLAAARDGLRLSSSYGNPNFLGFAASLGLPIVLVVARRRGRAWPAWAAGAAVILATLWLTYSRGAAIGAAAGVVVALALSRPTVRGRLVLAGGITAALALVAVIGYPLYENLRSHADFGAHGTPVAPDRSGWDPKANGLFTRQPSHLSNPAPGELEMTTRVPGSGASFPLGFAARGLRAQIALTATPVLPGSVIAVGMEDNLRGNGPVAGHRLIVQRTRLRLSWRPSADSPEARLYVWLPVGGTVTLSQIRYHESGMAPRALPTQLLGQFNGGRSLASINESRYIASREDAASLALNLFVHHLPFGIGWQEFPTYSARRLTFGALATHDEYTRYAAELGLPGIVLLIAIMVVVLMASRGIALTDTRIAALACLAAGAVGLVFANALEVPQVALPMLLSAALLCATGEPAQPGRTVSLS